jgi:protein-disulfide isomerase
VSKKARDESRELRKARAAIAGQRSSGQRWAFIIGGVVIAGLVIAIAFAVVNSSNKKAPTTISTSGPLVVPAGATAEGALVVGKADAPVKLDIYLDYMCPYCGRFEKANGAEIERLVGDGTVLLHQHPLAFLDRMSQGTQYSTRAANAVSTVADKSADKLLPFNNALYANQPEEGTAGLTDEKIAELARGVGVPDTVANTFTDRTFVPWVAQSTEKAFASGINGTPTVMINGKPYEGDLYTVGPLTQAINEAAK